MVEKVTDHLLEILSNNEQEQFDKKPKFSDTQREYYFNLNDYEKSFISPKDTRERTIYYILLLGYFKFEPKVLNFTLSDVADDVEFIKMRYFEGKRIRMFELSPKQKSRIYEDVFTASGFNQFKDKEDEICLFLEDSVKIDISKRSLLISLLDRIQFLNCTIPKLYKVKRIINKTYSGELSRLKNIIKNNISQNTSAFIQSQLKHIESPIFISNLKKPVKDYTENDFKNEMLAFDMVDPYFKELQKAVNELQISQENISYLSHMIDYYSVSKLKRMDFEEAQLYLICYLVNRFRIMVDRHFDCFVYWSRKIDNDAKEQCKKRSLEIMKEVGEHFEDISNVLDKICSHAGNKFSEFQNSIFEILDEKKIQLLSNIFRSLSSDQRLFYWEYISSTSTSKKVTEYLRKIFMSLDFVNAEGKSKFHLEVRDLKRQITEHKGVNDLDLRSVYIKDRPFLSNDDGLISSERAEFFQYRKLMRKMDKGLWYVENGGRHKPLEEDLVSEKSWEKSGDEFCENSSRETMTKPIEDILEEKIPLIEKRLKEVAESIQSNTNESVQLVKKDGKLALSAKSIKKIDEVNHNFFQNFPEIKITDIVAFIAKKTKFPKVLTKFKGLNNATNDLGKMSAVLLAEAFRMSLYDMQKSSDYTYDELLAFRSNYFRLETVFNAIDVINNEAKKLSIFEHYNLKPGIVHGSIDGQKFRSRTHTLMARYSSKYLQREKGMTGISINVNHFSINHMLTELNVHESSLAYDLAFNNTSDIEIDRISTDFHGINRFNFFLFSASDQEFCPRYPNFTRIIDSMFEVEGDKESLSLKLKKPIDTKAIIDGWDYSKRVFISLQRKEISQYNLIRKMSRTPPSNKSLKSMSEYDRLIKCLYILDLMENMEFRRSLQHVLNRGEAFHQLQRAIEEANSVGGFKGGNDKDIALSYACAHLLATIIIYFNAHLLSQILDSRREQGKLDEIDKLKQISPVAWSYINLLGAFSFDDAGAIDIEHLFGILSSEL